MCTPARSTPVSRLLFGHRREYSRHRRAGFTLVELLAVIAIVAVMIGILLPAIAHARRSAQGAVSLSNLRQCAALQATYAADFKGSFVNPFDPRNPTTLGIDWYDILTQTRSGNTPTGQGMWRWGTAIPQHCTEIFGVAWLSLMTEYNSANNLTSKMTYAPADLALKTRFEAEYLQQASLDDHLWDTSYWCSPTLWLSTAPYKLATHTPIGLSDSSVLRRNRFDDVVSPQAKAMVFERFDYSKTTRPHRAGGREEFPPMFNNPEATTRLALTDGSVDSIKLVRLYALVDPSSAPQPQIDVYHPSGDWDIRDAQLGDPRVPLNVLTNSFDLGRDGLENGDGTMLGIQGGFNKYPAFFWSTRKGVQGRDIPR